MVSTRIYCLVCPFMWQNVDLLKKTQYLPDCCWALSMACLASAEAESDIDVWSTYTPMQKDEESGESNRPSYRPSYSPSHRPSNMPPYRPSNTPSDMPSYRPSYGPFNMQSHRSSYHRKYYEASSVSPVSLCFFLGPLVSYQSFSVVLGIPKPGSWIQDPGSWV